MNETLTAEPTSSDVRSRAIGAGMVLGTGLGAAMGFVLPTLSNGDPTLSMVYGAGLGTVIGLLAGAAAYSQATRDE